MSGPTLPPLVWFGGTLDCITDDLVHGSDRRRMQGRQGIRQGRQ